jgi:putative ABC transport system permease protein
VDRFLGWVWQDLRYALRNLKKDRRFAVVAVFALALGIGASTVVFSALYNLMFHPFAARDANRLVIVSVHYPNQRPDDPGFDYYIPDFLSYRSDNHTFEDMVGSSLTEVLYSDGTGTRQLSGAYVTANAFEFYGVPALVGRGLQPADGLPGAPPVFVISNQLWQREFNADPDALGKSFTLNDTPRTLVGIMPPRFHASAIMPPENQATGVGVWLPITVPPGVTRAAVGPDGDHRYLLHIVGRLKPGVTRQAAAADVDTIGHRLDEAEFPPQDQPYLGQFTPIVQWDADYLMGSFKRILYALLGAVLILLLIACSNVANLLLARATTREREIAVRAALGASRARLVRQMLAESFVLAAIACAGGCALAYFGLKAAITVIPPAKISSESVIGLNPAVLLFALGVTAATTLLCGLAPAFHAARADLRSRLTGSGKGSGGGFRHAKVRAVLVVVEVALSIVLLAGAGLMMRTFYALTHVDVGFNPKNVVVAEVHVPKGRYDSPEKQKAFYRQILLRVSALPGVAAAAVDSTFQISSAATSEVSFPGKISSGPLHARFDLCSEGMFRTLGLHLLSGRLLTAGDVDAARQVAVINQALARDFLRDPNENPVGQMIHINPWNVPRDAEHVPTFQIVGVVADNRNRGVQYPAAPEAYVPYTVAGKAGGAIIVRTRVAAGLLFPAISREIWSVDRDVSVSSAGSLDAYLYQSSYAQPAFGLMTLGALAAISSLLKNPFALQL